MNTPFFHWFYNVKLLLILSALLCSPITQGATIEDRTIELDPILFDGTSRYKFKLETADRCDPHELAPEGSCDGKGFQLHPGQLFTVVSDPLVEVSDKNTRIEALFDNATSILVIPHLKDGKREVKATFTLSSFPKRVRDPKTEEIVDEVINTFVFIITKLEELNAEPTEAGALEFFDGKEFVRLPPGPEGAVLTMRNGKPAWTKHYQIGDVGPHGGTVFYVSENGLHGLEAAPKGSEGTVEVEVDRFGDDIGTGIPWGCTNVVGAKSAHVGAGKLNTLQIINSCTGAVKGDYAALVAARFSLSNDETSFSDLISDINNLPLQIEDINWYLPSADELALMREQSALLGLVPGRYWSSTERGFFVGISGDKNFAVGQEDSSDSAFSDLGFQEKTNEYSVRAIRDF